MRAEMEEAEQWAADLMDDQTGTSKKVQAAETMRMIPSDVCCEILDLNEGENLTGLCKRKKMIKTTFSPRVSEEIAAVEPEDAAEFMNAASQGKLSLIEQYLADGGNPNAHDELNRTALHRASLQGHTAVVHMLLERGADINFKDQSALLIGRGRAAVFQLGSRALHWACRGDSLGVVKALKSHGDDLNVRDKLYSTPLHVATRTGHTAIVEYLMSCGAKINSRDREGDTALHDAVRLNRYKIVKLLIVAGADTKIKNHEGLTAVQQVKQWQFDIMETLQRLDKLRDVDLPENPARAE